jgi:hypothetical protein
MVNGTTPIVNFDLHLHGSFLNTDVKVIGDVLGFRIFGCFKS